jgi:threonine aldolase
VFFLTGGTQANALVIATMLQKYEGVISAKTGHIALHEVGAIEYTGHKVIELDGMEGKLPAENLTSYLEMFYGDENNSMMVQPGMVYISHPTEYGTLYTKNELLKLREICDKYGMKLFLDGARLGFGLAAENTDVTLPVIAKYCDAFYIGGTKVGALFGEAVVFTKKADARYFFTEVKQHGALLAKGRLLGLQFDALFTDDLYMEISRKAVGQAMKIRRALMEKGISLYFDSYTNQQFFIFSDKLLSEISKKVAVDDWGVIDENGNHAIRITTSWATTDEAVDYLISLF